MKKFNVFLALILLILLSASFAQKPKTLQFWTISLRPIFDDYIFGLIKEYEKTHPNVKIEWTDLPGGEIQAKLLTAIASGETPDVVNLNTAMTLAIATSNPQLLTDMEKIVPISRKLDFFKGLWNAASFEGKTYAIPWYVTVRVVMYNKKIFNEVGIKNPPRTFQDVAKLAELVRTKSKGGYWGYAPAINLIEDFLMENIQLTTPDRKKAVFNTSKAEAILNYYLDLKNKGYIPAEIRAKGFTYALQLYKEGKLAMLLAGASLLKQIERDAPEVYKVTDVAKHPVRSAKILPAAVMNLVVPSTSKNVKEAVDFALFITNEKNLLNFCKLAVIVPPSRKAANNPYFKSEENLDAKARKIMAEQLLIAQDPNKPLPQWGKLTQILGEKFGDAWNGTKSAKQALDEAVEEWNKILSEQ